MIRGATPDVEVTEKSAVTFEFGAEAAIVQVAAKDENENNKSINSTTIFFNSYTCLPFFC